MTKEDIYRLIGYHSEYTQSVKNAIRKLLKENHPDNKGDRKRFELINEVKNELENNKVSVKIVNKGTTKSKNYDIDYEYCRHMIDTIQERKTKLIKKYEKKKGELQTIESQYRNEYRKNIDLELNLLTSSDEMKKIKIVRNTSIIMLIILVVVFILSIINDNIIILIIFVLLTIMCVIIIQKYFILFSELTKNNSRKLKKYVSTNNIIRHNVNKQEELIDEIQFIKKEINILDNDLRFYKNLLK